MVWWQPTCLVADMIVVELALLEWVQAAIAASEMVANGVRFNAGLNNKSVALLFTGYHNHMVPLLQRGSKRHSTAAVTSQQAYAGAAVARTATGQFAPAINSNKRRRTDGSSGGSGGGPAAAAAAPAGDAEYPGLPVGMKRPSLKVRTLCNGAIHKQFQLGVISSAASALVMPTTCQS